MESLSDDEEGLEDKDLGGNHVELDKDEGGDVVELDKDDGGDVGDVGELNKDDVGDLGDVGELEGKEMGGDVDEASDIDLDLLQLDTEDVVTSLAALDLTEEEWEAIVAEVVTQKDGYVLLKIQPPTKGPIMLRPDGILPEKPVRKIAYTQYCLEL